MARGVSPYSRCSVFSFGSRSFICLGSLMLLWFLRPIMCCQCIMVVAIDFLCAIDFDRDIMACQRVGGLIALKDVSGDHHSGQGRKPSRFDGVIGKPPLVSIKAS